MKIQLKQGQKQIIRRKKDIFESVNALYEGRELTLNTFKS